MLITKTIITKWHTRNRRWYIVKGYKYTKLKDELEVKVEDLMDGYTKMVDLQCDNEECNIHFERPYNRYHANNIQGNKDYCQKCSGTFSKDLSQCLTQNRELRIEKLKQIIEDNGCISAHKDSTTMALQLAFKINNEKIQEEVEKLGYNYYDLLNKKPSSYYKNIDNYKDKILDFIKVNKRFPTQLEINQDLHLSTLFNNGMTINELKQKLDYNNDNDLIDDNGYSNASEGEYTISQFIINNTDIKYNRDVLININEGKYNCDWVTEPVDNKNQVWLEYWGGYCDRESNYSLFRTYNEIHAHKLKLYKKYNLKLISIYPKDFARLTYDEKQEYLYEVLNPFMNFKYKHIENEIIIPPNKLSDEDLLINVMQYSEDEEFLPYASWLNAHKTSLYTEIISRFYNYQNYGDLNNKRMRSKERYWNKDEVFERFDYLTRTYGEITTEIHIKKLPEYDVKLKGMCDYIKNYGGLMKFKLEYFDKLNDISDKEIQYLTNIMNNINFTSKSTRPTNKQQLQAKDNLNKLNKSQPNQAS